MGSPGKTNDTSKSPKNESSGFSIGGSEHHILGDLGVMAVQMFSRSGLTPVPASVVCWLVVFFFLQPDTNLETKRGRQRRTRGSI
jgi:hypothetical protein